MTITWADAPGTVLFFRDLTLHGAPLSGAVYTFRTLDGWEGLPPTRTGWEDRPQGHGSFDAPVWAGHRTITVTGMCKTPAQRNTLLQGLGRALSLPGTAGAPEDLTVTHAGRTLTAQVRLTRYKPTLDNWGAGVFGWAAEWVAPDPLRYGPEVSATTGLPTSAGGLEFDLFTDGTVDTGWLEYGDAPVTGRVTLTNEGIADTHPVFTITGPLPSGFSIVHVPTGSRVEAATTILAGSTLVIDTATGTAVLDGVADRSGQLTRREWQPIPAEGTAEWAFSAPTFDDAAALTVTARPAYW